MADCVIFFSLVSAHPLKDFASLWRIFTEGICFHLVLGPHSSKRRKRNRLLLLVVKGPWKHNPLESSGSGLPVERVLAWFSFLFQAWPDQQWVHLMIPWDRPALKVFSYRNQEVGCSLWAALKRNEAANGERMEVSLEDASRLTAALKESTQPLMVMECGHFLGGKWRSWWIVILFLFHSYWCNLDQEVATLKKKVKKET